MAIHQANSRLEEKEVVMYLETAIGGSHGLPALTESVTGYGRQKGHTEILRVAE